MLENISISTLSFLISSRVCFSNSLLQNIQEYCVFLW